MSEVIVVAGVQSRQLYLTTNNRLRQAIGASQLMDDAIRDLPQFGGRKVYVGGGNATVIYDDEGAAREAIGKWSLKWLSAAPGMRLVTGVEYIDSESISESWKSARLEKLVATEERGALGCELLTLPVTAYCPDTGLAAQVYDNYHRTWKSAESTAKEDQAEKDRLNRSPATDLERELHNAIVVAEGFQFPLDLEHLGMPDSSRQIAIVHCDGNGMGELFENLVRHLRSAGMDEFVEAVGTQAEKCTKATNQALVKTFLDIRDRIAGWREKRVLREKKSLAPNYFPARLLVSAGDDATWICAGRLGIGSAIRFCRHFEAATAEILGQRRTACGGIAIVPLGFPIRRAHEIAEDLCSNAKEARKREGREEESLVDIHAMTEGLTGEIREVRDRFYRSGIFRRPPDASHPHRPLTLNLAANSSNSWNDFERIWKTLKFGETFQPGSGKPWPRSRIKRLLEELSMSYERGKECSDLFASQEYSLPAPVDACFDVLELFDFHVDWPDPSIAPAKKEGA